MEKSLYNQVGEVKGPESDDLGSFTFQFTPQNDNLKRTRGTLFALVSIAGKVDSRYEKAKNLYHQFQSSYYARTSGSILHGLSDTLEQLVKTSFKKEEDEHGIKISFIAAVFWGTVVYLSKHGSGAVFVARGEKVKKLDFAKVASGVLEDQDTVCLATEEFVQAIAAEDLTGLLTEERFEKSLEKLDKQIEKVSGAVCDVIRLSVNEPKDAPEELAIAQVDSKGEVSQETEEEPEVKEEVLEEQEQQEEVVDPPAEKIENPPDQPDPFDQVESQKEKPWNLWLAKAKIFLSALFVKIAKPWKKGAPGEHYDPVAIRRARIIQVVSLILILIVASIVFGIFSRGGEEKTNQINELLTSAENNLNEASNIKSIDPSRALALVDQAQEDLAEAKELDQDNEKVGQLEKQSSNLEAEITKTTKIENLETVTDLSKLKGGTNISDMAMLSGQVLLIDQNQGVLFQVSLSDKNASEVSGSDLSPQTVSTHSGGFYLTTQNGITKTDTGLKLANVGSNANWGKIVSSSTFQNNLYLLDTEKNEIWRYLSSSTGLGSARAYISGEKPDMTTAVSIAIDDLVWVATKNGTIYKFAAGKKQEDYQILGLADSIGELSDMFTSGATKNHYFLDKGKARVIVAEKTGAYLASYTHDQLHQADSLLVDEEQKAVYFSAGGKLYQFSLP